MRYGNNWGGTQQEFWEMVKNITEKISTEPRPDSARELGIFLNGQTPVFYTWQINPRHGRKIAQAMGVSINNLWMTSININEINNLLEA